ncbi:hypothetical protein [Phyllobacterium leguminum]|uniref:Uncharacterized protein n=1 Tax=Phyllobacterium leguminum TaxID=314237 RepID=A0A318T3W8_9HYPH|nr:hypothetical protein [Phyllobacterium leguminum]PYE87551.1 hypothetical protein C7477_11252 [Phyllobacterium leguminum]
MSKPVIEISPDGGRSPLPALNILPSLKNGLSYHEQRDSRHPLGIYNLSIARICDKVAKCADKLEAYWQVSSSLDSMDNVNVVQGEIIDYLELTMYAAAEHVDDLEEIAKTFYKSDRESASSADVRLLKKAIKPLRDEISNFANTIKHAHGRLRLYETDFHHDGHTLRVLGFFIEGWVDGGVAPHRVLHSGGKAVLSVTSFLWNVLTYVGEMSVALAEFLTRIKACDPGIVEARDTSIFRKTAIKLARLPLYSFDDDHPFDRVKWVLSLDDKLAGETNSGIYGSLLTSWSKSGDGKFGGFRLLYAGDGITRTFKIANPTKLDLKHWE